MSFLKENVDHRSIAQNQPFAIEVQDVSAIIGRFFSQIFLLKCHAEPYVDLLGKIVQVKPFYYERSSIRYEKEEWFHLN